ncbi:MAG: hypothetical protein DMG10_20695 [Acidobacteria bacterium]|nr:MAG: hypothetical protein DMG10_20695 [Acidobacteriota bacterium]
MRGAATKATSDIVEDPELRSGRALVPQSGTGARPERSSGSSTMSDIAFVAAPRTWRRAL